LATNALNQKYRSVSFNMDSKNDSSPGYLGQVQDPIRIMGGIQFSIN